MHKNTIPVYNGLVKLVLAAIIIVAAFGISLSPETESFKVLKPNLVKQDYMLPDLKVSSPEQLYIDSSGGERNIRFSTLFMNVGKAPLEISSESSIETETTIATQLVKKEDGSTYEHFVGEFVFHPTHDHWHIDDYAQFQIWTYDENGERQELVEETNKISFCIWDEFIHDRTLEGAPAVGQFNACGNKVQGLSVGWSEDYTADIEGQVINITDVPDGRYLIRTIVNVDQKILESDYSNNEDIMYVEIRGNTLTIL